MTGIISETAELIVKKLGKDQFIYTPDGGDMTLKEFYDTAIRSETKQKAYGDEFVYSKKKFEEVKRAKKKVYEIYDLTEEEIDSLARVIEVVTKESNKAKVVNQYKEADPERYLNDADYRKEARMAGNKAYKEDIGFDPKILANLAKSSFNEKNFRNGWDYANFADGNYKRLAEEADKRGILIDDFSKEEVMNIFKEIGWEEAFNDFIRVPEINPKEIYKTIDAKMPDDKFKNFSDSRYVMKAALLFQQGKDEITRLAKLVNKGKKEKGLDIDQTKMKLLATIEATHSIFPSLGKGLSEQGRSLSAISSPEQYINNIGRRLENMENLKTQYQNGLDENEDLANLALGEYAEAFDSLVRDYGNLENIDEFASKFLLLGREKKPLSSGRLWKSFTMGKDSDPTTIWDNWRTLHSLSYLGSLKTQAKAITNNFVKQAAFYIDSTAIMAKGKASQLFKNYSKGENGMKHEIVVNTVDGVPQFPAEDIDMYLAFMGQRQATKAMHQNFKDVFFSTEQIDPEIRWYQNKGNMFKDWRNKLNEGKDPNKIDKMSIFLMGDLPGRLLGSVDEYFKTATMARELTIVATKKAYQHYIDTGDIKAAEDLWLEMMTNPSEMIDGIIKQSARPDTFTSKIEGGPTIRGKQYNIGGLLNKIGNNPIMKMEFVFPRILLSQIGQGKDYIPGVGPMVNKYLSPNNKKILDGGGRNADALRSKQYQGAALMAYVWDKSLDLKNLDDRDWYFTGAKPRNKKEQDYWNKLGIEPWSVVFKKRDPKTGEIYFKSVSYELIAPLNFPIGLGATLGYNIKNYNVSDLNLAGMLSGVSNLALDTMSTNTMFTHMSYIEDLIDIIDNTDETTFAESALEFAGQYVTEGVVRAGTSVLFPTNMSAQDFLEDLFSPTEITKTPTTIAEGSFANFVQGINEVLTSIQSDTFLPGGPDEPRFDYSGTGEMAMSDFFPLNPFIEPFHHLLGKTPGENQRDNRGIQYLVENGIDTSMPNLSYIKQGPDFGGGFLQLNSRQEYQAKKSFFDDKLMVLDLDGKPMFPDAGPMTVWETVNELSTGLGKRSDVFRTLPTGGMFDKDVPGVMNTQSKEIQRVFKFYYDNAVKNLENDPEYSTKQNQLMMETMLESYQ